ncbi:MAG: bifunctional heptose 7-phosphate kinase/heptose 1-phosphate adenyltransferase [Acidobacteria bacterium]|nr:bifunctional heptose 7-phosphate kinase/heptose 1-phosphate adenyltransferase [Acidobacteriota bacterium]
MPATLRSVLDSFPARRVLVIGDVMLDEYLTGDCSRISPEAPVPVLAVSSSRAVLGGAANTANNIAALGGQAVLVGAIGDDETGRRLSSQAAEAGIVFRHVIDARPTVRKVRVVGQQQQLLRLDYDVAGSVDARVEQDLLETALRELESCDLAVISDYAKGGLTLALCQQIIARAHELGMQVVVDPRPQHGAFYIGCDFMTPNWKESQGLLGRPDGPMTPEAIAETGRLIAERYRTQPLLTLGSRGMTLFGLDGQLLIEQQALAREVFDVSGAGDTVVAMFALALAAGVSKAEAVDLANRAAGIVIAKLGTATVTPAELLRDTAPERALVQRPELAGLASRLRSEGRRVVTVNGGFDLMHAGHLYFLREARKQGDVLIVGVNSDASIRGNKGPDRPFIGEDDRARMLLALRDVDYVHIFDEATPIEFLDIVRPAVHVNGVEYGADCVEAPAVRRHGGRIHLVDRLPALSTTELVRRIRAGSPAGAAS